MSYGDTFPSGASSSPLQKPAQPDGRARERALVHRDAGVLVDRYGRTAEECAAAVITARKHAAAVTAAARSLGDGSVVLGRVAGSSQVTRLSWSALVFERIAARDESFAEQFEDAGSRGRS